MDHSLYYKFLPPQGLGWTIVSRNNYHMSIVKKGKAKDESFAIYIQVSEIPTFETETDFLKFIKNGREKDTDKGRFNILKDEFLLFNELKDYCFKYHSVAEDKKPVKRSWNQNPIVLEMAGYICRHPENKNIAIAFDYSNRYYKGNNEKNFLEKSMMLFKQLKF